MNKVRFAKPVVVGLVSVAAVSLVAGSAFADFKSEAKEMKVEVTFQRSTSESVVQGINFGTLEIDPGGDEIIMDVKELAADTEQEDAKVSDAAGTLNGSETGLAIAPSDSKVGLRVKNRTMFTSGTEVTPGMVSVTLPNGVKMRITPQFDADEVTLTGGAGSVKITDLSTYSSKVKEVTGQDGTPAGSLFVGGKLIYNESVEPTKYEGTINVSVLYQ